MPYIKQQDREALDSGIVPESPGELNYIITKLCDAYLSAQPSYAEFNEVIGVLECAKQEFYRRLIAPYEDRKKEKHGDVYGGL